MWQPPRPTPSSFVVLALSWAAAAHAQPSPPAPKEDVSAAPEPAAAAPAESDAQREARQVFLEGAEHARKARWAEALSAFEHAARIRPHPVTTYNIGACERALGMYTRARRTFGLAVAQHDTASGDMLPDTLLERARDFLRQIDGLLVRLTVTVLPADTAIVLDGRPLQRTEEKVGELSVWVAGDHPSADASTSPGRSFVLLLDPGAHVLTLSRAGFATAIVNKSFVPGSKKKLTLQLDKLPATLSIRSSPKSAIVSVDDKDMGPTPVEVLRPAGEHAIVVEREGFLPYEARLNVEPGQQLNIHAKLVEDSPTVFERWWFWTIAGTVVTGAVIGTYFAVRSKPEPVREEVSGGSFGYKIRIP